MPSRDDIAVDDILEEGETLLWRGPVGFNIAASWQMTVIYLAVAGFYVFLLLKLDLPWEICTISTYGLPCTALYLVYLLPIGFFFFAGACLFMFLERRALENGKAQGAVLLTNRRLLRISTWPWRRISARDYLTKTPRLGFFGVIYFGLTGSIILGRDDAMHVLGLMYASRSKTP